MHGEALYREIIGELHRSAQLEKRAAAGDLAALRTKAAHDLALLGRLKEAVDAAPVAEAVARKAPEWASALKRGLLFGGAATVPAVAGGTHLLHKAHQERTQAVEDIRNKALQVALGVGGIGAGLMGLHHALAAHRAAAPMTPETAGMPTPEPAPLAPPAAANAGLTPEDMYALQNLTPEELQYLFKQGSVDPTRTLQKLATVGYLDEVLADAETKTADAHELRLLNAEHGVQLLRELLEVA